MLSVKKSILFISLFIISLSAFAHFGEAITRNMIIEPTNNKDSIVVHIRSPAPLILLPPNWAGIDKQQRIPFTKIEKTELGILYYLDEVDIREHISRFKEIIMKEFYLKTTNGKRLEYNVGKIKIHNFHDRPAFNNLDNAYISMSGEMFPNNPLELFDAVIDFSVTFSGADFSEDIFLVSTAGEKFKATDWLVNVITYPKSMNIEVKTIPGTLNEGVLLNHSSSSFIDFFTMGIEHIFTGMDHMLFIVLMTLSCSTMMLFFKNVTGFTLGHMITLTLGATISTLEGTWFIPMIELAIAMTILYMAAINLVKRSDISHWFVSFFIGLIHGFGFSFLMNKVFVQNQGVDLHSLLGFNLGIEAGQVLLYGGLMLIFTLIEWLEFKWLKQWRKGVAVISIIISLVWIYQRTMVLIPTLI
jgi:hydrogenase/urease accessory protein HupE